MNKSKGFTLIELVIVIVILGILGAVAAPKLFNLQGDAYAANLNAMKSNIQTAMTLANAKAQIEGKMGVSENTVNGYTKDTSSLKEDIVFRYGYPIAGTIAPTYIDGILGTLQDFDAARYDVSSAAGVLTITPKTAKTATKCQIKYTRATSASIPAIIEVDTTDC